MSFTKVEVPGIKLDKKVSIRPYFDPGVENMGLEKYGLSLHEGVYHTEQLACLEKNGVKRYITGLNEFAPEVKLIADPDEKAAKIKEIRSVVSQLERDLAANVVDPEDPDFWNKIKLLKPDNNEFWDRIELRAGGQVMYLDPVKDPYDLIKIYAIDAGGFSIVAKSLQDAQNMASPPKFYLDRHEETVSTKNALRKLRNKALAALEDLYNTDANKLLYVTKVIDPGGAQYKRSTSNDTLYERMDNYINGLSFEKEKKRAAQTFIDVANRNVGDLKLHAMVRDAAYFKVITPKADGYLYHADSGSMLGKNTADVVEYLKNPMNEEILAMIQENIEKEWNK